MILHLLIISVFASYFAIIIYQCCFSFLKQRFASGEILSKPYNTKLTLHYSTLPYMGCIVIYSFKKNLSLPFSAGVTLSFCFNLLTNVFSCCCCNFYNDTGAITAVIDAKLIIVTWPIVPTAIVVVAIDAAVSMFPVSTAMNIKTDRQSLLDGHLPPS